MSLIVLIIFKQNTHWSWQSVIRGRCHVSREHRSGSEVFGWGFPPLAIGALKCSETCSGIGVWAAFRFYFIVSGDKYNVLQILIRGVRMKVLKIRYFIRETIFCSGLLLTPYFFFFVICVRQSLWNCPRAMRVNKVINWYDEWNVIL